MSEAGALERVRKSFPGAECGARAPGRANLIGEHTDYNEGFVLPVALQLSTYVVGRRSTELRLRSLDESGDVVVDVGSGEGPTSGWGRYVTAVVRALLEAGSRLLGLTGVVASDVPSGAGLSSSAALEVALATVLVPELKGVELAMICQRAENHFVGVASGIMDQLAASCGVEGHALLIDCRTNDVQLAPIPEEMAILVIDSAVRRDLATSAYNDRERECRAAEKALGVASLRDASIEDLDRLEPGSLLHGRARHIVTENERVLRTVEALRGGRVDELSAIFAESHRSYAEDFGASTPEIDALVQIAAGTPGVLAARLTGGGFGGCTLNLVEKKEAAGAAGAIIEGYRRAVGLEGRAWIGSAERGAEFFDSLP